MSKFIKDVDKRTQKDIRIYLSNQKQILTKEYFSTIRNADKTDFKKKKIIREKEDHCIMTGFLKTANPCPDKIV